jgi:hypothetical protein
LKRQCKKEALRRAAGVSNFICVKYRLKIKQKMNPTKDLGFEKTSLEGGFECVCVVVGGGWVSDFSIDCFGRLQKNWSLAQNGTGCNLFISLI